jgi:hypothetical protein
LAACSVRHRWGVLRRTVAWDSAHVMASRIWRHRS